MRCLSADALELLRTGATVVTPRPWLASAVRRQFVEWQKAESRVVWRRPHILSLHAWLTSLWKERRYAQPDTPVLVTASQENFLWHHIIEGDDTSRGSEFLELAATAREARSTALACAEYELPLGDPRWRQDHDPNQFAGWLKKLNQLCEREGWITIAGLWGLLPKWLDAGGFAREPLLFVGFDTAPPALARVARMWPGDVTWAPVLRAQPQFAKYQCETPEEEWELAARWARTLVEKNEESIGILVPGLDGDHARVRRVFDDVFDPGHLDLTLNRPQLQSLPDGRALAGVSANQHESGPVHVGHAGRLRDHPFIASALLVLEMAAERMPMTTASALLRSPYIKGAAEERLERAHADLQMRKSRELEVSLASLLKATRRAPQARRIFSDVQVFLHRRPESADFAYWARFISDLLKLAGWPGDTELSAPEQALVEEWKDALSTLASLGMVSTTVTWPMALSQFRRTLSVQKPHGGDVSSPVQVLDPSEASGIQFDHLWITGLSAEHWRLRTDAHPLIPRALQVEAGMPQATSAGQRQHERSILDSLLNAGRDVVASYASSPLPLLNIYLEDAPKDPALTPESFWRGAIWHQSFSLSTDIEKLPDSEAPHAKNSKPGGGTRILKHQSECPFRAFAEIRLSAIKPVEGTFGFDALERGQFLHHVLEFVWKEIGSQERLKQIPSVQLDALVREGIAAATANNDDESDFHRELTAVERLRLGSLVLDWLDLEKKRLIPFTVQEVEQGTIFEIEGVTIKLRIDRVDRLNNGNLLLVDYKSGRQKSDKLLGERPDEPQLLVYAAAMGEAVEGVLFGQVMRGELELVGVTKNQHTGGKKILAIGAEWARQQREWNETVLRLAKKFKEGEATVDPKSKAACQFCDMKPLCRIQEIRADEYAPDEEGEE